MASSTLDPAARLEALDKVMEALAHPARRQILLVVRFRGGEVSAGDIAARFAHAWPTTTRHLRVLEAAGLLTQERRGRQRVYRLDTDRIALVREYLAWVDPPEPAAAAPVYVKARSEPSHEPPPARPRRARGR